MPLIILEPVKPIAAYLIATGQIAAGIAVLAVGEILKLVIIERLFKLCRRKLLKIPLFAWAYARWQQGVNWIVSIRAWQVARRRILLLKLRLKALVARLKRSLAIKYFHH